MTGLILPRSRLGLQTRHRQDIANIHDRAAATPGMQQQVDDYKKEYKDARHRPVGPCGTYNCHGLTFAARRTAITQPEEISKILRDDDYELVPSDAQVLPGDTVVYFKNGDAEHSGIVVQTTKFGPLILSKWGGAHEVIHKLAECPYDATNVCYYRVCQ